MQESLRGKRAVRVASGSGIQSAMRSALPSADSYRDFPAGLCGRRCRSQRPLQRPEGHAAARLRITLSVRGSAACAGKPPRLPKRPKKPADRSSGGPDRGAAPGEGLHPNCPVCSAKCRKSLSLVIRGVSWSRHDWLIELSASLARRRRERIRALVEAARSRYPHRISKTGINRMRFAKSDRSHGAFSTSAGTTGGSTSRAASRDLPRRSTTRPSSPWKKTINVLVSAVISDSRPVAAQDRSKRPPCPGAP